MIPLYNFNSYLRFKISVFKFKILKYSNFQDIHILDAGCGTGQYTKALLDLGIGRFTLLDASAEMLEVAREKLADATKDNAIANVVQAVLPELPFENGVFDAVMFISVSYQIYVFSLSTSVQYLCVCFTYILFSRKTSG